MAKRHSASEQEMNDFQPSKSRPDVSTQVRSNSLKITHEMLTQIKPLTQNQSAFIEDYKSGAYFMAAIGSAGTGKSYISIALALDEVLSKDNPYEKVVIVRSAVQGRDIGFTPGTVKEKAAVYETPYSQICSHLFKRPDAYHLLVNQKRIEFTITSFMRGTTFDNSIIIVDECQNMSWQELNTIITRIGHQSKIILCGDVRQDDLTSKRKDVSGLSRFLNVAYNVKDFCPHIFTTDDIVRSSLVKNWIVACENFDKLDDY